MQRGAQFTVKQLVRFVLGLLAPFILIFGGGGLVGIGIEYELPIIGWIGAVSGACGLLWGAWLLLLDGASIWGD